jgi:hypothetical protein
MTNHLIGVMAFIVDIVILFLLTFGLEPDILSPREQTVGLFASAMILGALLVLFGRRLTRVARKEPGPAQRENSRQSMDWRPEKASTSED